MLDVLFPGATADDDVINDLSEARHPFECLIHPTIVVFGDRRHAVRGSAESESPERCREGRQKLGVFCQRALMVPLERVEHREPARL